MIHREGYWYIFIAILVSVAVVAIVYKLLSDSSFRWAIYGTALFCLVLVGLVVNFFRNPHRDIVLDTKHILAPCDGKVVVIEDVAETVFLNRQVKQISIFMSPLNVHVNRNPISGVVEFFKYYPGKYLVAWHPKSSEANERTYTVVSNSRFQVGYKQIAGAIARRICYYIKVGDSVRQGDEFGFIKFGSRMDVLVPLQAKVQVKLNQQVVGGQTVLATIE